MDFLFALTSASWISSRFSYSCQDLNCGCPIDVVCNRGCGSSLMNKHNKLCDLAAALAKNVPSRSITVKVRTGWDEKNPTTHKLLPLLQKCTKDRIAAVFVSARL